MKLFNCPATELLQKDLDKISEWSTKWDLEFNTTKCRVMEFGKNSKRHIGSYTIGTEQIPKIKVEKDLSVTIQGNLSPEKHITKITGGIQAT